ncbi:IS66 family transposase, partial [Acetivibrio mesophilus]
MKKQEISVEKLLDIIEEKERRIAELEQQVQWFMEQIRLSKRKQFGVSSEQTKIEQLNLFNEDEETHNLAVSEPQRIEVKTHYRKRTRLTTDKLPADLPMEVIEHKLPEKDSICPDCGGELHTMGKETRDELKVIPAK